MIYSISKSINILFCKFIQREENGVFILNEKPQKKYVSATAQIIGFVMIISSALLLLLTMLGNVLGPVGIAIKSFFLGTFGFSFFADCLAVLTVGIFLARGIRPSLSKPAIIIIAGVYIIFKNSKKKEVM